MSRYKKTLFSLHVASVICPRRDIDFAGEHVDQYTTYRNPVAYLLEIAIGRYKFQDMIIDLCKKNIHSPRFITVFFLK
jgi:hypothetical protein